MGILRMLIPDLFRTQHFALIRKDKFISSQNILVLNTVHHAHLYFRGRGALHVDDIIIM